MRLINQWRESEMTSVINLLYPVCHNVSICCYNNIIEMDMSSFLWNFHHWQLSFWQLLVQAVMEILSKWWHFRFKNGMKVIKPRTIKFAYVMYLYHVGWWPGEVRGQDMTHQMMLYWLIISSYIFWHSMGRVWQKANWCKSRRCREKMMDGTLSWFF